MGVCCERRMLSEKSTIRKECYGRRVCLKRRMLSEKHVMYRECYEKKSGFRQDCCKRRAL